MSVVMHNGNGMQKIIDIPFHFVAEGIVDRKKTLRAVEVLSRGGVNNEFFFRHLNASDIISLSKLQIDFFLSDYCDLVFAGIKPHINVSVEALLDDHYIDFLVKKSAEIKVAIEINGFSYTTNLIKNLRFRFSILQQAGHEVWLDDFGDDASSVTLIMILPWSGIKIDKTILWSGSEKQLASMVSCCLDWTNKIIIEGVESDFLHEKAMNANAGYSQGYLFNL